MESNMAKACRERTPELYNLSHSSNIDNVALLHCFTDETNLSIIGSGRQHARPYSYLNERFVDGRTFVHTEVYILPKKCFGIND